MKLYVHISMVCYLVNPFTCKGNEGYFPCIIIKLKLNCSVYRVLLRGINQGLIHYCNDLTAQNFSMHVVFVGYHYNYIFQNILSSWTYLVIILLPTSFSDAGTCSDCNSLTSGRADGRRRGGLCSVCFFPFVLSLVLILACLIVLFFIF